MTTINYELSDVARCGPLRRAVRDEVASPPMKRKKKQAKSVSMANARNARDTRSAEDVLSPVPQPLPKTPSTSARELRPQAPVNNAEASRYGLPYSQMPRTTGKQLGRDVKAVMKLIDVLSAGEHLDARRTELIQGILKTAEFEALIEPPLEYKILERGIKRKWEALSEFRRTMIGRIAANTVSEAVAMGLDQEDLDARDGRVTRLCDLVGFSRKVLKAAQQRLLSLEIVALLDPTRATRKWSKLRLGSMARTNIPQSARTLLMRSLTSSRSVRLWQYSPHRTAVITGIG
jgi:hypothetical protein